MITRRTRVTSKTVSLIDNIFTNSVFDTSLKLKKGIIKSDVSDHFPVFISLSFRSKIHKENQKITINESVMHDTNVMAFKTDLRNVSSVYASGTGPKRQKRKPRHFTIKEI